MHFLPNQGLLSNKAMFETGHFFDAKAAIITVRIYVDVFTKGMSSNMFQCAHHC